jgi:hypothetical protein
MEDSLFRRSSSLSSKSIRPQGRHNRCLNRDTHESEDNHHRSVAVTFFQEDYVSDKVQGYEATFGFYSQDGTAISDIEKRTIASEAIDPKKRNSRLCST